MAIKTKEVQTISGWPHLDPVITTDGQNKTAKKHDDSIAVFKKGGREDLAKKEQEELAILQAYLPKQMGRDEVIKVVRSVIEKQGAQGVSAMGAVMKEVMTVLKGQAPGKLVSEVVGSELKK